MQDKNRRLATIYRFVPMIALMILIFAFSAQAGDDSSEQSGLIVDIIFKTCDSLFSVKLSSETLGTIHHFVRKLAHFSEYALLAGCVSFALQPVISNCYKLAALSEIITVLYALSDEIHQFFVPGRVCAMKDVLIDSLGGLAITVMLLIIHLRSK